MSGDAAKDRKEFVTFLICNNRLLSSGREVLLANTRFAIFEGGFDQPSPRQPRLHTQPDLFIVDANASSDETLEIIKLLKVQQPDARVAMIASHFDVSFVRLGLDAGVDGFCLATSKRQVLINSLELIMMGEKMLPGALIGSMLNELTSGAKPDQDSLVAKQPLPADTGMHKLSNREAEILRCLMRGEPNKVIAKNLMLLRQRSKFTSKQSCARSALLIAPKPQCGLRNVLRLREVNLDAAGSVSVAQPLDPGVNIGKAGHRPNVENSLGHNGARRQEKRAQLASDQPSTSVVFVA